MLLGYVSLIAMRGRLDAYFTDDGLLPLSVLEAHHLVDFAHTPFRYVHTHAEAVAAFVLIGGVYVALATGFMTRVAAPLALFATVSLHHRVPMVVNGSMITMHMLLLWSMFLPLGRHASFDAWFLSRRGERLPPLRVRTFAVFAFRCQLAVIYLFNVLHKGGTTWKDGSAVHYVLWQSRALLPFGRFIRTHETAWFSPLATYGTFVVESLIVALVLLPVARTNARRLAAGLMLIFHLGLGTVLDLGPFPFVFSCAALLLLASEDGAVLARVLRTNTEALDERHADAHPRLQWLRTLRETAIVALAIHAAIMMWTDNAALRLAFGRATEVPWARAVADAAMLHQGWSLFAPDAPTRDVILMPVVTLADGRVVDVRTRREPDFELLDGRLLDVDFFHQTYDAVMSTQGSGAAWQAYGDYLARLPRLAGWAGERRVSEVVIHQIGVARPAFGEPPGDVDEARVRYMRQLRPTLSPARLDL